LKSLLNPAALIPTKPCAATLLSFLISGKVIESFSLFVSQLTSLVLVLLGAPSEFCYII
jgi:hypothetical protein